MHTKNNAKKVPQNITRALLQNVTNNTLAATLIDSQKPCNSWKRYSLGLKHVSSTTTLHVDYRFELSFQLHKKCGEGCFTNLLLFM